VSFGYNAAGQPIGISDAAGNHVLDYANGRLEQETITGGVLDGWVLDPSYGGAGSHGDNGRLTGLVGRLNGV
jgi:YD repeat-containing protein